MNNEPVAWMRGIDKAVCSNEEKLWFIEEEGSDWNYVIPLYTRPVKALTNEDRVKVIGTLKWAEDLLREAGHDEAVDEVQDCIMLLRKAQEK